MDNATTELLDFIIARNVKTQEWVDARPDRWSSKLSESADYWESNGIFTVEDFERDELHSIISDASKEANGCRTRINPNDYTIAELRDMADYYSEAAAQEAINIDARQQEDVQAFQSQVASMIELGAGDEETALRWMTQDEEFYNGQDVDGWVWSQGILFTDYGRDLVERLRNIVTFESRVTSD